MFIEVIYDATGNITSAYYSDVPPENANVPLMEVQGGLPTGHSQCRIYMDSIELMKLKQSTGKKAVIVNGNPEIVEISPSEYIIQNHTVDVTAMGKVNTGAIKMPRDPYDKMGLKKLMMRKLKVK